MRPKKQLMQRNYAIVIHNKHEQNHSDNHRSCFGHFEFVLYWKRAEKKQECHVLRLSLTISELLHPMQHIAFVLIWGRCHWCTRPVRAFSPSPSVNLRQHKLRLELLNYGIVFFGDNNSDVKQRRIMIGCAEAANLVEHGVGDEVRWVAKLPASNWRPGYASHAFLTSQREGLTD